MPLYFVTGISGSGKSTVREHLRLRGYEAYATDEDGYASWFDNETGEEYARRTTAKERTPEFSRQYSWKMPRPRVATLAAQAAGRPIFLCGALSNEIEVWDLFAAVIALDIDTVTLKVGWRRGPTMISANQPTNWRRSWAGRQTLAPRIPEQVTSLLMPPGQSTTLWTRF